MSSSKNTARTLPALALGASLLLTGCAQQAEAETSAQRLEQSAGLQVTDAWAKAAESGMSAAFAVLENTSDSDIVLESVSDVEHGTVMEIHEMTGEGADTAMRQIREPLVIAPGSSLELAPGGNHIMYMGLTEPLVPAEVATLSLAFADGSSKDVDFAIRNYDGASESYHAQDPAAPYDAHGEDGH